jgi:hypothetical protein
MKKFIKAFVSFSLGPHGEASFCRSLICHFQFMCYICERAFLWRLCLEDERNTEKPRRTAYDTGPLPAVQSHANDHQSLEQAWNADHSHRRLGTQHHAFRSRRGLFLDQTSPRTEEASQKDCLTSSLHNN